MSAKELVREWFEKWEQGDYFNLPISDDFTHHSPFGTIRGSDNYLQLVKLNEGKFLGQHFELHDEIYADDKACVRYTARQGKGFKLTVSEWYYFVDDKIAEIHAYYHIGEIREERTLNQ